MEAQNIKDIDSSSDLPVKVFADQLASNEKLPLEQTKPLDGVLLRRGSINDLPLGVQSVVGRILEADTIAEKVAISHAFTSSYIKLEEQDATSESLGATLAELANDPRGDCDDFARFEMGLLVHGGVDPERILFVVGIAEYSLYKEQIDEFPDKFDTDMHAFLIVEDEQKKYLLVDNNLEDTPVFNSADPVVVGTPFVPESKKDAPDVKEYQTAQVRIPLIGMAMDAQGTTLRNDHAVRHVLNTQAAQERLSSKMSEPQRPSPDSAQPAFNTAASGNTGEMRLEDPVKIHQAIHQRMEPRDTIGELPKKETRTLSQVAP